MKEINTDTDLQKHLLQILLMGIIPGVFLGFGLYAFRSTTSYIYMIASLLLIIGMVKIILDNKSFIQKKFNPELEEGEDLVKQFKENIKEKFKR